MIFVAFKIECRDYLTELRHSFCCTYPWRTKVPSVVQELYTCYALRWTIILNLSPQPFGWGGTGGRETGRKGGGRCTGGGRRGGGKRDSQGGGKREKKGKIMQHCAIFLNRKNAKGRERKNTGREPGLKGTGSGRFKPPLSPPHFW